MKSGRPGFNVPLHFGIQVSCWPQPCKATEGSEQAAASSSLAPVTLLVKASDHGLCFPQVIWRSVWQPQTWRTSCTAHRRTSCSFSGSMPAHSRGYTRRSGDCNNTAQVPRGLHDLWACEGCRECVTRTASDSWLRSYAGLAHETEKGVLLISGVVKTPPPLESI